MIANELEYRTTKTALRRLEEGIVHIEDGSAERHPLAQKALRESIESEILNLRQQVKRYEGLQTGDVRELLLNSLSGIADALIAGRIAAGWSQQDFAEQMGLKAQQVQRYEATRYESASLSRLIEVAGVLDIGFRARVKFASTAAASSPSAMAETWLPATFPSGSLRRTPAKQMGSHSLSQKNERTRPSSEGTTEFALAA